MKKEKMKKLEINLAHNVRLSTFSIQFWSFMLGKMEFYHKPVDRLSFLSFLPKFGIGYFKFPGKKKTSSISMHTHDKYIWLFGEYFFFWQKQPLSVVR